MAVQQLGANTLNSAATKSVKAFLLLSAAPHANLPLEETALKLWPCTANVEMSEFKGQRLHS